MDAPKKPGRSRPGSLEELGRRIEEMLESFPNREAAAKVAGRKRGQLYTWAKGQAEPPFLAIAALAIATGISMEWLATGEGQKRRKVASEPPPYDAARMRLAMRISAVLAAEGALPKGYSEHTYATALYEVMMGVPPAAD